MQFTFGEKRISLPKPHLCPECRQQIRTAHRNERYLYHRKENRGNKQIISLHHEQSPWGKPYQVYTPEDWHSDFWDGLDFGRDIDFSRPFFEQFAELHKEVPRLSLVRVNCENSPYTTGTGYCKNCHLINSSEYCEDCYYGKLLQSSTDCVDCAYCYDSELCYECFDIRNCYGSAHLLHSENCSNCWFSENLSSCSDCLLCTNLQRKQYCVRNEQFSREGFQREIEKYLGSDSAFRAAGSELRGLRQKRIHKYALIVNSEDCSGDFIRNSKNCIDCYDVSDSRDCRYLSVGVESRDIYNCSNIYIKSELNYEVLGTIEAYHCAFSLYAFHSRDILYSEMIFNSDNLFGCVGLRRKQFCVLNKQYPKAQYEELVPQVIEHMKQTGEWGSFFPAKYSAYGYNETLAAEYFPLMREEVLALGWNWCEREEQEPSPQEEVVIADNIRDVSPDICRNPLYCRERHTAYKIMPQELRFYQRLGIPVPRLCPDERYDRRMSLRNPRRLYLRCCENCGKNVETTFAPSLPEQIFCESCYLEAVR